MTHGPVTQTDFQNLVTVRPGPVLHVWRAGGEFCNVPLSTMGALNLITDLASALRMTDAVVPKGATPPCA